MTTQDIVIRVIYESDLKEGIQEVEALGKAAKKDIDVFKSLSKEIDLGINDALKESGVTAKQFSDAIQNSTKASSEGFKSLRQQIKEAKEEAQKLAQEFGGTSSQAVNAQKKVAGLSDELADFNSRVQALNPEAKFKAFSQVAQGGIGALQGLTGAMQIFGSENEDVNKIVQKFQGFINVTQGIESIAGLSDTFKNLGAVLGITTTAQNALKTSTVAGAVATEGATAANYAFAASLSATGIGAIVVAIGLLIGAWIALENQIDDATAAGKVFEKQQRLQGIAQNAFDKKALELINEKNDAQSFQLRLAEAQGKSDKEILALKIKQTEEFLKLNNAFLNTGKSSTKFADELHSDNTELIQDLQIYNLELNKVPENIAKIVKAKDNRTDEERLNSIGLPSKFQVENELADIGELSKRAVEDEATLRADFFKTEDEKNKQERIETAKAISAITLQGASDTAAALNSLNQQETDSRIANLDTQLNAGLISEQEYAKKVSQIKRKQAEQDKKTALFNASINIAQAIINALTIQPASAAPAAVAFAAALGAIQLAAIQAKPIPAFNKGTLSVGGIDTGKDSVLAMLRPNEAVIPVDMKQAYLPTLQAMFEGSVKPSELNAMVSERRTGKSRGGNDNSDLIRAIKSKSSTSIRNAEEQARLIGKEISNSYNPRYN